MRRREFIALIGGTALPLPARAQATPVVGYLGSASSEAWAGRIQAFRKGLEEAGFVEGRNVVIEYRWADGRYDRLPDLATDLVRGGVNVIVAPGSLPAALAATAATATIPIVFETGANPVRAGLVPSLNKPGGNVTGVTALSFELGPKRLEVLREVIPSAAVIAVLANPTSRDTVEPQIRDLQDAARRLGVELQVLNAPNDRDFVAAFAALTERRAGGLVIVPDVVFNDERGRLAALALRYGVPAIFQSREFAAAGGLISYGGDIPESHRLAGAYVGRVLKGEKPADLPVVQASKVQMIVNLRSAKALGLTIPQSVLARADEVIE